MKTLNFFCITLSILLIGNSMAAQDPSFSQFFASPLNINPALTGDINGKWRVITNYRKQWNGLGNPYNTGTLSADTKIFQNLPANYKDENTRIAIGGMMMFDETMGGALKSNYASLNIAGNIRIASVDGYQSTTSGLGHLSKFKREEGAEHRIGVGLGIIYGNKRLDITKLNFAEQFNGSGFDTNLPTGEGALSDMKPYISASAGVLYSFVGTTGNLDIGFSAFHFNKPKQSLLSDPNQFLATRYVGHANVEAIVSGNFLVNANGIYQYQSGASYFSVGGALGYYLPTYNGHDMLINAGVWYWSNNSVIPYVGFSYGNFQVGLTYDITTSQLTAAVKRPQTFEFCLIFRGGDNSSGIPAPWK